MRLADVVQALEAIAPPATAETWDNVGLLVGDPAVDVSRAMLCIDYTQAVAIEAKAAGCELVIAYHPPIFKPLRSVTADGASVLIFDAARDGIAIYSPHTALDVADGGTNDVLADILGLTDRRPLRLTKSSAFDLVMPAATPKGIGRVGTLAVEMSYADVFARIKSGLAIDHLLIAGPIGGAVRTIAVCAGAGGEFLDDALAAKVDLYLTGELRHHDALRAAAAGMTVVCTLHSHSERITLKHLIRRLVADMPGVAWQLSAIDIEPFTIA